MAVVWAQLYVNQVHYGIHAFIVPLRNKDGSLAPHVRIMDNGHKPGLNGVDNGRIMFSNKHIPKENLLNRYGEIDCNGNYSSKLPSNRLVFAYHMGKPLLLHVPTDTRIPGRFIFVLCLVNLSQGRVNVASHSTNITKVALATAIRYSLTRRQFSDNAEALETVIFDYSTQQVHIKFDNYENLISL